MTAITTKTNEFHGLRWNVCGVSDHGKTVYYAHAWNAGTQDPQIHTEVSFFATELEALDALRAEICRKFRKANAAIANDRGDRINIGGGYR